MKNTNLTKTQQLLMDKAIASGGTLEPSPSNRISFSIESLEQLETNILEKTPRSLALPKAIQSILRITEANGDCC